MLVRSGRTCGPGERLSGGVARGLTAALAASGLVDVYEDVESLEEAEERARDLMEAGRELGLDDSTLRTLLLDGIPEEASWADGARETVEDLLAAQPAAVAEEETTVEIRAEVASLSDEESLRAYADLLSQDPESEGVTRGIRSIFND